MQGFDDQKLKKKNYGRNFLISFFDQKLQCLLDIVQATGEAFSPQKRTSSTSKNEMFVGHFCPPGFGSRSAELVQRKYVIF
jgi:hypothetical protein